MLAAHQGLPSLILSPVEQDDLEICRRQATCGQAEHRRVENFDRGLQKLWVISVTILKLKGVLSCSEDVEAESCHDRARMHEPPSPGLR